MNDTCCVGEALQGWREGDFTRLWMEVGRTEWAEQLVGREWTGWKTGWPGPPPAPYPPGSSPASPEGTAHPASSHWTQGPAQTRTKGNGFIYFCQKCSLRSVRSAHNPTQQGHCHSLMIPSHLQQMPGLAKLSERYTLRMT